MKSTTALMQRLTLLSIALVLCVPILSRFVPIPSRQLSGLSMNYRIPSWSWKGVKKGKYQAAWEVWATRDHPVWSWSIVLTNELLFRLFGELSLDYYTSIQGGDDGYLWQPMYLKSFNGTPPPQPELNEAVFKNLAHAQRLLKAHNIPLIGVINPNIIHLYPELIPDKYKAIRPGKKNYDVALEAIGATGAEVVDTFAIFQGLKDQYQARFFTPTGSHWNNIGSCVAVKAISPTLVSAWHEEIPDPLCERFTMEDPPRSPELDLIAIANLLSPRSLFRPAPYVTTPVQVSFKKPRKVLLIGTSFLFGLEKELLQRKIADSTTLLFYFKQIRKNGEGSFHGFDRNKVTKEFLLGYDAIIVDANVSAPGAIGRGALPVIIKAFGETPVAVPQPDAPGSKSKKRKKR